MVFDASVLCSPQSRHPYYLGRIIFTYWRRVQARQCLHEFLCQRPDSCRECHHVKPPSSARACRCKRLTASAVQIPAHLRGFEKRRSQKQLRLEHVRRSSQGFSF